MLRLARTTQLGLGCSRTVAPCNKRFKVNVGSRFTLGINGVLCRQLSSDAIFSLPHLIQTSILGLHAISGTPWWGTIALATVCVRVSMLPLVRSQIIASRKLAAIMPEANFVYQLFMKRISSVKVSDTAERMRLFSVFFKGINACFQLQDLKKRQLLAYPLINMGVFMTFVFSVRDLIVRGENYDMCQGGILWFVDLTVKDPTFALPLTALCLTYTGLELAFAGGKTPTALFFKDFAQSLVILTLPFVAVLPAGVFCYWIPSSLFAITQSQVLKSPLALKLLNIPPLVPPAAAPTPAPAVGEPIDSEIVLKQTTTEAVDVVKDDAINGVYVADKRDEGGVKKSEDK